MRQVLFKTSLWVLILLPVWVSAQAPYTDTTCNLALRICTGQSYVYPAWTGPHPSQSGPSYGCLGAQNDPAWFYFVAGNTGDVHITISSSPCKDVDFICWGPFNSLEEGCGGGLTASKIIDCNFGNACIEYCDLASMTLGSYYVLLVTNYSMLATTITVNQTSGTGIMQCLQPPTVTNNGPVCVGQNIQFNCSSITGGSYLWSGPGGFSSTQQNPTINNATTSNSGTYSVVVSVGAQILPAVNTTVTVNPLPIPAIISPGSVCSGSSISIGGASYAGYSYNWASVPPGFSSTLSNPTVNPLVNTSYFLVVTSAQNCTATANTSISVNPLPSAFVIGDASICQGAQIPLGGNTNPNYIYSWTSNPPGFISNLANPTVSPAVTTTYTLSLTNQYSCTRTYTFTISVISPPAAFTGPNQGICIGNSVLLGGPAVPGNTYSWTSNPAGFSSNLSNPSVTPSVTTTYILTETNSVTTCSTTNQVIISISTGPLAVTGPNTSICAGNSITLGTTAVPGNTYSWISDPPGFTSNLSNPSVNPTITTTYTLTESSGGNCSTTHSVIITVNPIPAAYTGPAVSICEGSQASLGNAAIPGHTYQWTSIPSGFISNLSNPVVSPTTTTTYILTETITSSACTATNSVLITVNPLPIPGVIPNTSICSGNSVYLGAMPVTGNTYLWSSNPPGFNSTQANPQVSPLIATTYTLQQTITATGCSKSATTTISVNPLPFANAGVNSSICAGNSIIIGTNGILGNTYQWSSNPPGFSSTLANPSVSPSVTTTYTVTVTNTSTNCSASHSVTISILPGPAAFTGPSTFICSGNSLTLGGPPVQGNMYSWTSFPTGFTSNQSNPVVSPSITTTFFLIESSPNFCSTTHSVLITVNPSPNPIVIPNTSICSGSPVFLGGMPVLGNTYSWVSNPAGFTSTLSNPQVNPIVTTSYTLTQTITATGCSKSTSTIITVTPGPVISLSPFQSVCNDAAAFALSGGFPAGGTYSGPGVSNGYFNPSSLTPGSFPIVYSYGTLQGCIGNAVQNIQVVSKPKISGTLKYMNVSNSPLDSSVVKLSNQQNVCLDSFLVYSGNYHFNCLQNGLYKIRAISSKHWGGGNALDALLVARYSVGLIPFTEIQKKVADVNQSGSINSVDSYLIIRRWAGMINSFPSGDWYITKNDTLNVVNQDVNFNLQALCYGDVDGSFIPGLNPGPEPISFHMDKVENTNKPLPDWSLSFTINTSFKPNNKYSLFIHNTIDNEVIELFSGKMNTNTKNIVIPAENIKPGLCFFELLAEDGTSLAIKLISER